jgi:hypothetical protein
MHVNPWQMEQNPPNPHPNPELKHPEKTPASTWTGSHRFLGSAALFQLQPFLSLINPTLCTSLVSQVNQLPQETVLWPVKARTLDTSLHFTMTHNTFLYIGRNWDLSLVWTSCTARNDSCGSGMRVTRQTPSWLFTYVTSFYYWRCCLSLLSRGGNWGTDQASGRTDIWLLIFLWFCVVTVCCIASLSLTDLFFSQVTKSLQLFCQDTDTYELRAVFPGFPICLGTISF